MKSLLLSTIASLMLLLGVELAWAQSANEVKALKKEIESIKETQKAMEKDIQDIKNRLEKGVVATARPVIPAPGTPSPAPTAGGGRGSQEFFVNVAEAPVRGDRNA